MSDPVSKVEDVEDVLSSIRRLVSETGPSGARKSGAAQVDGASVPKDALLLTSSLRVNAPKAEQEAAPKPADTDEEALAVTALNSLRAAVGGAQASSDAPNAETDTDNPAQAAVWPARDEEEYYEDEAEDISPSDMADVLAGSHEAAVDEGADATVTALDNAAHANDDAVETEGEDAREDDQGFVEMADMGEIADPEDVMPTVADAEEPPEAETADPTQPGETEGAARSASIVEDLGVATYLRSAPEPKEIEDAEFEDEDPFDDEDDDDLDMLATLSELDGPTLDEEMLRDMVKEIVREELSGELGERITRNVRKLVRREIHRAMLTREFE